MIHMKKSFNALFLLIFCCSMFVSCLNKDDSYSSGFTVYDPANRVVSFYANGSSEPIIFFSYGNWSLTKQTAAAWYDFTPSAGSGETYSMVKVTADENRTGESRYGMIRMNDTDHPGKANADILILQHATRGDGSLGSASDVKRITGSDGSEMRFAYDNLHRPTDFRLTRGSEELRHLAITYRDGDSLMMVVDGATQFSSPFGKSFQPLYMISDRDSMGYTSVNSIYITGFFNFEHRNAVASTNTRVSFVFRHTDFSLDPDSLHRADSLFFYKGESLQRKLGLTYSPHDNRCQSIDVNQLLLPLEDIDPYLLLSFYRYARNTSIISQAASPAGQTYARMEVALNDNRSVHELKVIREDGTEVLYTFEY